MDAADQSQKNAKSWSRVQRIPSGLFLELVRQKMSLEDVIRLICPTVLACASMAAFIGASLDMCCCVGPSLLKHVQIGALLLFHRVHRRVHRRFYVYNRGDIAAAAFDALRR